MHVAGKMLAVDPKVFDGKHGTVLDSGTTYAYLPEAAFGAFKQAVRNSCSHLLLLLNHASQHPSAMR